MSEIRRADGLGNMEPKSLSRYFGETVRRCTTCQKSKLYIKMKLESSTVLECPNCDETFTVPKGTENMP